jgi:hypothetical protein
MKQKINEQWNTTRAFTSDSASALTLDSPASRMKEINFYTLKATLCFYNCSIHCLKLLFQSMFIKPGIFWLS